MGRVSNLVIFIAPYNGKNAQIWAVCNEGITQFYLPPTHEPYPPLLLSRSRHR